MSTILKLARLEFKGGPMENHWGFVGQSMGAIIDAIDLGGGMGRYEKVGKGVEECAISEDGKRVFYEMVHIDSSNERQSARTVRESEAAEPATEELMHRCRVAACSDSSLWEWIKDAWCGGPDLPIPKVMKFFICMGLFNIAASVVLIILKLCKT